MFHLAKGALAGRRRGLLIGIVAACAAATAAGAAPASLTPWATHTADVVITKDTTTTTAAATTTTAHEPSTTIHAPEPTVPVTTIHAPEPTVPVTTTIHKPEPTTTTHAPEPAPLEPSTTAAPQVTEPAPATTTTTEVHTPATLQLSCALIGDPLNQVTCEWTGPIPDGFVRFLLLRGNQTAKGRVPFNSTEPTAHTFTDEPLPAGSYSYVVVIIGSSGGSIAHSNLVPIVITTAG